MAEGIRTVSAAPSRLGSFLEPMGAHSTDWPSRRNRREIRAAGLDKHRALPYTHGSYTVKRRSRSC